MKRLLIALAAAAAVMTTSASIKDAQSFEFASEVEGFFSDDSEDGAFDLVGYGEEASLDDVYYPFDSFGEKYLSFGTSGDTGLKRNVEPVAGNVYFDMAVKIRLSSAEADFPDTAKIAVYLNSNSNVVIAAGVSAENGSRTNYVTTATADPCSWARLTISSLKDNDSLSFQVRLDGVKVETEDGVDTFPRMTGNGASTVSCVGFKGSGEVDGFVVRTTDPFYSGDLAAKIGTGESCEKYATLEEALDDAAPDAVVELADDHVDAVTGLELGATYRVRPCGFTFGGFVGADGVAVSASDPDTDGVVTYTGVEGVAAVSIDGENWIWYASFVEAYAAACSATLQPDLKVKIDGDFTPTLSRTYANLWSLTFISETDDPVVISLADGDKYIATETYTFPANATVTMPRSQTVGLFSGGAAIVVPEDVAITLKNGSTLNGVSSLSGTGTIVAPSDPASFIGNASMPALFTSTDWQGTLEFSGSYGVFNPASFANAGSTLRFDGFTVATMGASGSSYAFDVELVGDGLTFDGDYTRTYYFNGALSGSGALKLLQAGGSGSTFYFAGDVSGFSGSVVNAGTNTRIVLGANSTTSSGQAIVVASGASITNGTDTTWSSYNLVILGELTVNGTVSVTNGCVWGNTGTGRIRFNSEASALPAAAYAGSWNGTSVIAWNPGNVRFVFDNYATAKGTVEIVGENGVFSAFPSTDPTGGTAPTVNSAIVLNANWTINNGWSNATTTFASLSGAGDLTVNGSTSGTADIPYTITTLTGYTGTLGGARGRFTIGTIVSSVEPVANAKLVNLASGAKLADLDQTKVVYGGVEQDVSLEQREDGIYVSTTGGETELAPGETVSATSLADAEAITNSFTVVVSDAAVLAALTNNVETADADVAAYKALFAPVITPKTVGEVTTYEVSLALTPAAVNAVKAGFETEDAEASIASALSDAATAGGTATVGAVKGLYYSVEAGSDVHDRAEVAASGERVLATGNTVNVSFPNQGTSGFYRILVNTNQK